MLHALAALPDRPSGGSRYRLLSCIYDIPSFEDAGHLDKIIFKRAWMYLQEADFVWASDVYKSNLARKFGKLARSPIVCHNCPPLDYLPESTWPRDGWLRAQLRQQGAVIGETDGCVLLRAGAVGECGGIEETIHTLTDLPENFLYLLMGRPPQDYRDKLLRLTSELGMQRRVFLWEWPSDEVWKKALLGADIGHLIHGPFPPGRMRRAYELNSSLSNYRLFQYMAAGLPIIAYDDPRMDAIYKEVPCFRVLRPDHQAEDIKTLFLELGNKPQLRRLLGAASRNAHETKYCWEKQFNNVIQTVRLNEIVAT
jgi:glycosyltransferase involved in cell wall biosynthesis